MNIVIMILNLMQFHNFYDQTLLKRLLFLALIWAQGPAQGLYDTAITAGANYLINFTESGKRFVLRLHHNGSNSFLYVNAVKML